MGKKIKIVITIFLGICFIVACLIGVFKYSKKGYWEMKDPLPVVKHSTWYKENKVVMHATGGIDGLEYTNSKDALLHSINQGAKVIEVDFNFTSDKHLVCFHKKEDFYYPPISDLTFEKFKNTKVQGKYEPLIFEDVVEIMKQYPDIYISIDTKHEDLSEVIKEVVKQCSDETILKRFIIQCYYPGEKEKISQIYNFPNDNYLFAPYKYSKDPYETLEVCYEENYNVVVVNKSIWEPSIIKLFKDKNIYLYTYTVNREDVADLILHFGAWGIYTDFLTDYIEKEY